MEKVWKVIYTSSRQEKKVAALLQKADILHYLPLNKQLRVWSDRKKWVEVPLFNGYIFVKPGPVQRDEVLNLPGVVKYLRYNGIDASVTDAEIALIKNLIAKGYDIAEHTSNRDFEPGQKVQVISGPLKNYEGEILSRRGEYFAFITLHNFGHVVRVQLPVNLLKKIKSL